MANGRRQTSMWKPATCVGAEVMAQAPAGGGKREMTMGNRQLESRNVSGES